MHATFLQHAVACRDEYPLIWWITAEDTPQIQAGLAAAEAANYSIREVSVAGRISG